MKSNNRFARLFLSVVFAGGMMAGIAGTSGTANAQAFQDIKTSKAPLVLKAQGSFYVGGQTVEQTLNELGSFLPAGHISINQMYVRYMIPRGRNRKVALVMVHGMGLTGKTWETTPDGRMGWDEYFVRKGHPVYVPDQVGRGRSGFDQAVFNNVRTGAKLPGTLPAIWRTSTENTWPNFCLGLQPNQAYPDTQFPVAAVGELAKQGVPDLSMGLPTPNPNFQALSELATAVNPTVLVSHSQSGSFPLEAALINPAGIKGMVLVEPGGFMASYTDQQITTLAKVPALVIFGDHLDDAPTGVPGHSWKMAHDVWKAFIARVNAAGGKAQMLYLPDLGIRGNSHMIMQDKNNLQIADLILKWMKENLNQSKAPASNKIASDKN